MDPATLSVSAVTAVLVLKMVEKTAESLSEVTIAQIKRLLVLLHDRFPQVATTLDFPSSSVDNPFDFESAAKQLEEVIVVDAEVKQTAEVVDAVVKTDAIAQKYTPLTQAPHIVNNTKVADEVKNLFQGGDFRHSNFY